MDRLRERTIETYDQSAEALAEYFRGIGPRIEDIDAAFDLAGNPEQARVLEIGCGDGRDAKEIVQRAGWYHGLDASSGMINLARQQVPTGSFEIADAVTFQYPPDLDIVFAFASLLHLDKEEVQTVFGKVETALKPGGVFYISLKEKAKYTLQVKQDFYGSRLFYFYTVGMIVDMAGEGFDLAKLSRKRISSTDWFEIALKKR